MNTEERIKTLIKPLVEQWLDQAKDNNANLTEQSEGYKKAKLECARELDTMLRWQHTQIN